MSAQRIGNELDSNSKWLYRVGGMSALAVGVAYLIIIVLYIPAGAPPSSAEERLVYLSGNTAVWWAILDLSVLTDFLFIPVGFSLYLALKGINKNVMLLATCLIALFIILDLAITWTNYATLITLSDGYAAATNDAERAVYVTAAIYPSIVLGSRLLFVYNTLTLSVGILLTGVVMLKGIFSKSTAYLGLGTGILGIVAVIGPFFASALNAAIILASLLTTLWVIFAGYNLYKLGRQ